VLNCRIDVLDRNRMSLQPSHVFCAKAHDAVYAPRPNVVLPELPAWATVTTALLPLRSLFLQAGLDSNRQNSADWNPLSDVISQGQKVVIKPNWVYHRNPSGHGLDSLVTHTAVIEAILHYVVKTRPRSVLVCDAPIQGCDFDALTASCGVWEMVRRFTTNGVQIAVKDLRRTVRRRETLSEQPLENCRPLEDYVLYDLGSDSSLEPITTDKAEFRVTMYNPDLLKHRHAPGKHQYLVAREVMDADVVINVPKLKTHQKAGITGALKNVVGINGHKEYLPHHRKGGAHDGGDCYPGKSLMKTAIEKTFDSTNRATSTAGRRLFAGIARAEIALAEILGEDINYDGSWHGNDTVWRMTLDLQRILHYGLTGGRLSDDVQRKVLTITDAIVAGQGDGPLAPTPAALGMMTLGTSTPALEWVHAILMGMDPRQVPLTREAFTPHRYPLVDFHPEQIVIRVDGREVPAGRLFADHGRKFRLPRGWQSYAEPLPVGAA
jgi:uncharacterized protein (DUF362 family)